MPKGGNKHRQHSPEDFSSQQQAPMFIAPPQRPKIGTFQKGSNLIDTAIKLESYLLQFEAECTFLNIVSPEAKKECLKICGGPEFINIDAAITLEEHFDDAYEELLGKIKTIYPSNHTFKHAARAAFVNREQGPDETFLDFYLALSLLADRCQFNPNERKQALWTQLVYKTTTPKIREFGFREEPTLEELLAYATTLLTTTEQSHAMGQKAIEVKKVQHVDKPAKQGCFRCGSQRHNAADKACPALGKTCHNCNKANHFASVCKGPKQAKRNNPSHKVKKVSQINEADQYENNDFLDSFVRHIKMHPQ